MTETNRPKKQRTNKKIYPDDINISTKEVEQRVAILNKTLNNNFGNEVELYTYTTDPQEHRIRIRNKETQKQIGNYYPKRKEGTEKGILNFNYKEFQNLSEKTRKKLNEISQKMELFHKNNSAEKSKIFE